MSFEPLGFQGGFYIHTQLRAEAWLLIGLYAIILLAVLWRARAAWRSLTREQWLLFAAFLLAAGVSAQLFLIRFQAPVMLTPLGLPEVLAGPAAPLFGGVFILLSGAWLGVGPAVIVGFVSGLARAGWGGYYAAQPFEYALLAALAAALLRQRYHGALMALLRRPIVAGVLSAALIWPLVVLDVFVQHPAPSLAALDYAWAVAAPLLPVIVLELLIGGALVGVVYRLLPGWRPNMDVPFIPAPWQTSLGRRLLYTFLPVTVLAALVIVGAVGVVSYNTATDLVVAQMARDANNAASTIPVFIETGSALIRDLAGDIAAPEAAVEAALRRGTRAVAFFSHIAYYAADDPAGAPAAQHPPSPDGLPPVTPEERERVAQTLATTMPQDAAVTPIDPDSLILSFVVPVQDADGETVGALLGRTLLDANPIMQPVVSSLTSIAEGRGEGFVVDKDGNILLYPADPSRVRQTFTLSASAAPIARNAEGAAYRTQARDGTTRLVYVQPAHGSDGWSVVITLPNVVILERAVQIAAPLVVLLGVLSALALGWIYTLARARITRPMALLAVAADQISSGDLDYAIPVAGVDEIGRLGASLAHLRANLKRRLDEQALLLQISQAVSTGLNVQSTVPPILKGCLQLTDATSARIILSNSEAGKPLAYAAGPAAEDMAALDRRLLEVMRDEPRLVIEHLSRARAVVDASILPKRIESLVALALRQEDTYLGVLWLGYTKPHQFTDLELTVLGMLASHATVTIAKARLFEEVYSGREQLEIILASTDDAVLVIDRHQQLVVVNRAAEAPLRRNPATLRGKPVHEALADMPELVALFERDITQPETSEITGHDGRTYEATASPLMTANGAVTGRVVVLHDITHYIELDEMKNDFVQTVSHDLRSPLTYMRGYATMLTMVGALNEKQQKFADKIVVGIEQMSNLIENILDIGRIESGGELESDECNIAELVTGVVAGHRAQALTKEITLTSEVAPDLPTIIGDEHMLRQAITNLIDNAVKYSNQGGHVNVKARQDSTHIIVSVADDGSGISQADQAHLFEKFYRVRKRETMGVKGSGLGLAIVRGVARRHGGDAWVESRLGEGSTFYLSVAVSANGEHTDSAQPPQ
ncbi:MAG: ATP-binding protein [Anaerolineae bacterium]|nr:ATP-binding protein [Anaerolineae bacterium]